MKHSLSSISLAAVAAAATLAFAHPASSDAVSFDRLPPTYPEISFDGWRNHAGEPEKDNAVQTQLGSADGYRNNAGESDRDNVVQQQLG